MCNSIDETLIELYNIDEQRGLRVIIRLTWIVAWISCRCSG